jgi:hypothetical protein
MRELADERDSGSAQAVAAGLGRRAEALSEKELACVGGDLS